jgi:hypothetical protein
VILKENKFIGNFVDGEILDDWRYCDAGAIYFSCLPSKVLELFPERSSGLTKEEIKCNVVLDSNLF